MTDHEAKATKFYIRFREDFPETEMQEYARRGFWTLGIETAPFHGFGDIASLSDLGPTVGVAGYIGDVHEALKKLGREIPENIDYPECLEGYLGRKVWRGTLDDVRRSIRPLFVKPVEHKAFTGFVWRGQDDRESRLRVVTQPDECPVWIADPIDMQAEYRSFILHDVVIDCRRYKGDWSKAPSRDVVESAVHEMRQHYRDKTPAAYCLDWAVTPYGTVLTEMNEGYAFGHYGLEATSYARMLSARWHQMASVS